VLPAVKSLWGVMKGNVGIRKKLSELLLHALVGWPEKAVKFGVQIASGETALIIAVPDGYI